MADSLFSIKGWNLKRLVTLSQIAKFDSISAAARQSGKQQPQFTMQLGSLEKVFGAALYDRERNELTALGKRLVELTNFFVNGLNDVYCNSARRQQKISLGAGDTVLQWMLFPQLPELFLTFPNTTLTVSNLRSRDIKESLLRGDLDFGILRRETCADEKALEISNIGPVEFALFVPVLLHGKRSIPAVNGGGEEFTRQFERIAPSLNPPLEIVLTCQTFPEVKALVQSRSFGGMLPVFAAQDLSRTEFEETHHEAFRRFTRNYVLAVHKKTLGSRPELEKFQRALTARCAAIADRQEIKSFTGSKKAKSPIDSVRVLTAHKGVPSNETK